MNIVRVQTGTHYAHAGAGKTLCGQRWSSHVPKGTKISCNRCLNIVHKLGIDV